ncbi:MAG TPA: AI-2E family transporter [Terriglobales bacterium]|nr:AI-2E family transporter [Terriglobales bacterium]
MSAQGQSATRSGRRSEILFTLAILALLAVAWMVRDVLLLIYVSILFAVVLSPAIDQIRRIHIGHWWPGRGFAIFVIIMVALLAIASFAIFALPPMLRDFQAFTADLPHRLADLHNRLKGYPFVPNLDADVLQREMEASLGGAFGFFAGLAGALVALFSWLIITAYFILDGHRTFYWFLSFFPDQHRRRLRTTLLRGQLRMRHWLVGQGLLMLILGVCASLTFWLLHLRYSFALGMLAGAMNIVPFIGPLASFVLAVTVAALDGWSKVIGVLIFYAIYQQIEQAYLTPRIMTYSVNLSPLAVIIALSLGASLAGVLGALVAVPTAALIAVIMDEYLVRYRPEVAVEEQPRVEPPVPIAE